MTPTSNEPQPEYTWDYEAISACPDPLAVVQYLAEVTSKPGFRLSRMCRLCEAWDRGYTQTHVQSTDTSTSTSNERGSTARMGLRPNPPGAVDVASGCDGCWYSYLDEPAEHHAYRDRGFSDYLLARMREGLEVIPKGHPHVTRRRAEHEERIRELEDLREAKPDHVARSRGRVLVMYLEVVE